MIRQYELVERVRSYDPAADEDLLHRAYVFSLKAHGSQLRASGDSYFSHPLEVAGILTGMRLDTATIVTALLHDTVEDTVATLEDIQTLFGSEICRLVDGVTKLSRIELQNANQDKQYENFRKLVLAMSEDIRVLLVKLADRLHNMRTLHYLKNPDKRRRIARETLEIYAPLAERIGIHQMKDELEDLAFGEINPDARASIQTRLDYLRGAGNDLIQRIIRELQELLVSEGLDDAVVTGREKTPYSIWRKLERKNVTFEQLSDIMAFRIVVDDIGQCYQALGLVHSHYPVVPGRFKDYISIPKPNGYKSIHTCVIGPERQRIEVQIRSGGMHEINELGVAAHWAYKQGQPREGAREYRWLRELLDILEHARPEEFLEHTKLELFQDQVFCFTPKGDLINLPRGATPVDFAYSVHSIIGDTCVGAKINGRMMPLKTVLQNGDQVEIVTSKAQKPNPDWERFVVTGKARARLRKYIRTQQRAQYVDLGKGLLQKTFRAEGYDFNEKALEGVLKIHQAQIAEDILANVGAGVLSAREVFNSVYPGHRSPPLESEDSRVLAPRTRPSPTRPKGKEAPLPIRGLIPGMAVHYARCCHPLPGDRIVGIVTTGKGVTIHTIDCETLESFHESPERWIDVAWDLDANPEESHTGRINVIVANAPGSLGNLSTVIGKNGGNISNLKVVNRSTDFFELLIDIDVKDNKHLTHIVAALRAMVCINGVERTRGR